MTKKYSKDNRRLEREARIEPPIHIDSTSGWLPSRGGCNLLYPPKLSHDLPIVNGAMVKEVVLMAIAAVAVDVLVDSEYVMLFSQK